MLIHQKKTYGYNFENIYLEAKYLNPLICRKMFIIFSARKEANFTRICAFFGSSSAVILDKFTHLFREMKFLFFARLNEYEG